MRCAIVDDVAPFSPCARHSTGRRVRSCSRRANCPTSALRCSSTPTPATIESPTPTTRMASAPAPQRPRWPRAGGRRGVVPRTQRPCASATGSSRRVGIVCASIAGSARGSVSSAHRSIRIGRRHMRVGIVGAGVSGLATAFYLKRARPDVEVVDRRGGLADPEARCTPRSSTASVSRAGGNGFLTNKPDCLQLVNDSGGSGLLLPSSDLARKRYIYTDRLHRMPESPPLFAKSKLLTLPQKLRMLGEFAVPARRDGADESAARVRRPQARRRLSPACSSTRCLPESTARPPNGSPCRRHSRWSSPSSASTAACFAA